MNYKGILKRLLPFAATFAVAVFITSFFVDISASRFGNWRARRWERRHACERQMFEYEQLRNENLRLRNELRNLRADDLDQGASGPDRGDMPLEELRLAVPPPPIAPAAPVAPHRR